MSVDMLSFIGPQRSCLGNKTEALTELLRQRHVIDRLNEVASVTRPRRAGVPSRPGQTIAPQRSCLGNKTEAIHGGGEHGAHEGASTKLPR